MCDSKGLWLNIRRPIDDERKGHDAVLDSANAPWWLYAVGYKYAADVLVEHVVTNQRAGDILVYPIAYLYRHYMELMIKELTRYCYAILDRTIPPVRPTHRLKKLWNKFRSLFEQACPNICNEELNFIEMQIGELSRVDPEAITFRYPEDRGGCPNFFGVNYIALDSMRDAMSTCEDGFIDIWHKTRWLLEIRTDEGRRFLLSNSPA